MNGTVQRHKRNDAGFTVVEIAVSLVLLGFVMVGIMSIISSLQYSQRSNEYLNQATITAKGILETQLNKGIAGTPLNQTIDKSSEIATYTSILSDSSASLRTENLETVYGTVLLEVTVTYKIGSDIRMVKMSDYKNKFGSL
jgi:Tfp pilus assembly protein PilV